MNLEFKDQVWKAYFKPTEESVNFEDDLRTYLGLQHRYESATLLIGRSLAEPTSPESLSSGMKFSKSIAGEHLFGDKIDLWLCALILDGQLGVSASVDDFRALVEAHWARGCKLLKEMWEGCGKNEAKFITRLSEYLPEGHLGSESGRGDSSIEVGEIRVKVGAVSRTFPGDKPVDFVLNGQGTSPHIALMGAVGKGKTTTGVQIAMEIVSNAHTPVIFIDPKGEFVSNGAVIGPFAALETPIEAIEIGVQAIPLDFLPSASVGNVSIQMAAMKLRDTIVRCCKSPGDIQQDLLRRAIEGVIRSNRDRDLVAIRDAYEAELQMQGKESDSIVSRLNELTGLHCFVPEMQPSEFFKRSWILSLKELRSDELKRLIILMVLDSVSSYLLSQAESPIINGFRSLRQLLVVDEARKILRERKYESLVDLVRQGRSKGACVILLSQDPSDFEGQADDFTTQLGTVIAFACAQSNRGLRSLRGVFGRVLQPNEFSDTHLPVGIALTKLPGREAERIRCWQPPA